jgi:hypothetical protein
MIKEGTILLLLFDGFVETVIIKEHWRNTIIFSIVGKEQATYNWSLDHFKTKVLELSSLHKELL